MTAVAAPSILEGEMLHGVFVGDKVSPSVSATFNALRLTEGHLPSPITPALWRREDSGERYRSVNEIHVLTGCGTSGWLLQIDCEGKGRFAVAPDAITVDWQSGTSYQHYLQTLALALWLEARGLPCIHANTLALDDDVSIGLLAPSRGGKSTLSAALVDAGLRLMTDDMAALYYEPHGPRPGTYVYPARPQLRLWPDSLATVFGATEGSEGTDGFSRVHARFDKRLVELEDEVTDRRRLDHVFVLDRDESGSAAIGVEPMTPATAMVHCIQQSILADAYQALGLQEPRVAVLAGALNHIKFWRLRYPSGHDQLPAVAEAIREWVRA